MNKTRVLVIQDASGSMWDKQTDVIGGFNAFLGEQRKVPGKTRWTLIQFCSSRGVDYVYENVKGREVPKLDQSTYVPNGATPLLDALGKGLTALLDDESIPTIVLINTDGFENASREYSKKDVAALVKRGEDLGWQFIWAGVGLDALSESHSYGFSNVHTVSVDSGNTADAYLFAANSATMYRNTGHVTALNDDQR